MSVNEFSDYYTIDMYAARVGKTRATIDRWIKEAEDTEYALGESDMSFARAWHIDKWVKLQGSRLKGAIDEALKLGLVVRFAEIDELRGISYEQGWFQGYTEGRDGLSDEIPSQKTLTVDPDSEAAEAKPVAVPDGPRSFNLEGLTVGGFTPIV